MAALSSEEHALKMMVKLLKTLTKSLGEVKDEISLIASFYNRYPKAVEDEIWDWASRPCYELDRERNGVPCRDLKKAASEWALLSHSRDSPKTSYEFMAAFKQIQRRHRQST